jgi:hypothetical protein
MTSSAISPSWAGIFNFLRSAGGPPAVPVARRNKSLVCNRNMPSAKQPKARARRPVLSRTSGSNFFGPDHEMNNAARFGNKEAVKILAQIFYFIAPSDAVNF